MDCITVHALLAGDLATVRADSYITVVDRKKDMILCGGENVYCTEVEAVLLAHPRVAQAAVFGVPNAVLGELVAAAVVIRADAPEAAVGGTGTGSSSEGLVRELGDWCCGRLAHYKVPSQIHLVDSLPVTGSGKILKTELKRIYSAAVSPVSTAPADNLHLSVSGISIQQLAASAAAAGGPSAQLPVQQLSQPGLSLNPHATYVLPVVDGVDLQQQAQAAFAAGAYHLLLLAGAQPSAMVTERLSTAAAAAGAVVALAIINAGVTADCDLFSYVLYDLKADLPFFEGVLLPAGTVMPVSALPTAAAVQLSTPTPPVSAEAAMAALVQSAISDLLGNAGAAAIGPDDPLMSSGVNSTLAVALTGQLECRLKVNLPPTLVGYMMQTFRSISLYAVVANRRPRGT